LKIAYRIVKRRHVKTAFDGEGARIAGGRWNSPGHRAVYLSSTLSLAALETFVHLGVDAASLDYGYFTVDIPTNVGTTKLQRRPRGWQDEPPSLASMRIGDSWLRLGETALLEVPSAIVPTENNFLLNPSHRDFAKLRISPVRAFQFDPRMWK
jgi:RES domain-containing protein